MNSLPGSCESVNGILSSASKKKERELEQYHLRDIKQDIENANQKSQRYLARKVVYEKEQTIIEIMARLDLQDEEIAKRVESKEYQSLVKKTFRE